MEKRLFWVEVLRLRPTAVSICRDKIDGVLAWFDPEDLSGFAPLAVGTDGELNLYLLDGHARAFALWATGVDLAPVYIARKDLTPVDAKAADISALELV